MTDEENSVIQKKIWQASLSSIVISVALIVLCKSAQNNNDLLTAFILVFTSNLVMLVYLFGLRHYFKLLYKPKKDGAK